MLDGLPFFLSEAQISLWLQAANGSLTGGTIFIGGFANRLRMQMEYEENRLAGSGDTYQTTRHVDESHLLDFGQTWLISRTTLQDWKPARNTQYVLELVWTSKNIWLRRRYYGVTWRTMQWEAPNTNQFLTDQSLRAQYYVEDSGGIASPPPATPVTPPPATQQPVGFFRENPLIVGEYLLGFYQWNEAVNFASAQVIAWAPQLTPMVLGLEVGGVLTGQTITIPVGTANTEVTANATLGVAVPANTLVRWKVLSGPDATNAAWSCALTCQVST